MGVTVHKDDVLADERPRQTGLWAQFTKHHGVTAFCITDEGIVPLGWKALEARVGDTVVHNTQGNAS